MRVDRSIIVGSRFSSDYSSFIRSKMYTHLYHQYWGGGIYFSSSSVARAKCISALVRPGASRGELREKALPSCLRRCFRSSSPTQSRRPSRSWTSLSRTTSRAACTSPALLPARPGTFDWVLDRQDFLREEIRISRAKLLRTVFFFGVLQSAISVVRCSVRSEVL